MSDEGKKKHQPEDVFRILNLIIFFLSALPSFVRFRLPVTGKDVTESLIRLVRSEKEGRKRERKYKNTNANINIINTTKVARKRIYVRTAPGAKDSKAH